MRKYRPPRWHFDIGFDSLASSCLHLLGNVRGGPLIVAIILGFDWVVSRLLIEDPQAGRQVDRKGITALWWAAWAERLNMMRILVETHQVDFARSDRGGRSPVSWAASRPANAVILTYLLDELNLEPDTLDRQGRSPLSYSAEIYCYRNIDALLRTGKVNINSVDNEGRTPLVKATQLQFRAKVTKRNPAERKYKMRRVSSAIATLRLLDHAPDVNLQDVEGNTALINAAQNRVVEGVRALIRHGADVNVQDIHGRTALAHAAEKLCFESVEALLKAGADANLCDDEGRSPLWLATESMNHLLPRYDIHGKMENMRGVAGLLQSSKGEDGGLKSHGRGEDLVRNHTCEEGLIKVV
ncbi:ankyrin repeat-containing domain protein [Colletotrichum lupini]|nr:ankyrin repeat-containing domain protein [Colletotrichum lupini]